MNYNIAQFEKAYGLSNQLPASNAPEIAFAGRSNVGKSSLLNKLFNRKSLARVSSVPGKTITINFYDVDGIKFVDLPGYGYAKISRQEKERFGELMEGYFQSGRNIRLVVQLVDMRHKPSADDYAMIEFMKQMNIPFVIAMTKSDKLKVKEYKKRLDSSKEELTVAGDVKIIPFSSQNGEGVEELKKVIEQAINQ
ncbi:MAG: ribosome biogenesis GTP-binding protein YihA/YsxC [Eubacterium sp.]